MPTRKNKMVLIMLWIWEIKGTTPNKKNEVIEMNELAKTRTLNGFKNKLTRQAREKYNDMCEASNWTLSWNKEVEKELVEFVEKLVKEHEYQIEKLYKKEYTKPSEWGLKHQIKELLFYAIYDI